MAYSPDELIAFIAIEGDHFEALTASPDLYTKRIGDPIPDDEESVHANPATFDDLVMASGGGERSGPFLIAVVDGWTFLATPWEFPLSDYGYTMRLAKHFGARAFQIDFAGSGYGDGFLVTDADGAAIRYAMRTEYAEAAECFVLGAPLPEESEMPKMWDVDDVLKVFRKLGGPDFVGSETLNRPFEKTAWFEMTTDIIPQDEREALSAIVGPATRKERKTTPNDPAAFTQAVEPAGGGGEDNDDSFDKSAYYEEANARERRGTRLYYRTVLSLWVIVIACAVAAYYYFF
ncbi:MAG: hypothetical protein RIM72_13305 [Alphaproteobacteria bacterium]